METAQRIPAEKQLRKRLRQQVDYGRIGLLAILLVTLLNQLLLMFKVSYHFLFSASVPYYLNWLSREMGGHAAFKALAVVLTFLIYAAYVGCCLMSGQRKEWLMAALGLYALDTLLLVIFSWVMLENPASCLLEILVHLAALLLLFNAVRCADKLSKMPRRRRRPPTRPETEDHSVY